MLNRTIHLLLAIVAILSVLPAREFAQAASSETAPALRLLHADREGVIVELQIPEFEIQPVALGAQTFARPAVPGLALTTQPGHPQLPVSAALIGAPPGAEISLEVLVDDRITLPGKFRLPSAPWPASPTENFQPGAWQTRTEVGALAGLYPASPARLADEAWLRDRRIVRLEFYPFQYDSQSGALLWHRKLRIAVRFTSGEQPTSQVVSVADLDLSPFLLNAAASRAWRAQPSSLNLQSSTFNSPSSGPRYKIVVDQDGLYQITGADFQAAGMDIAAVDPRTFRLTNQGRDVAIAVSGEADGQLALSDAVTFYGEAFSGEWMAEQYAAENTNWITYTRQLTDGSYVLWHPEFTAVMAEKYTAENVYWLTAGGPAGPRMVEIDGDPAASAAPIPETFPDTARFERSLRWWTWHQFSEDTWFDDEVLGAAQVTYTLALTDVATGAYSATVRAEVGAATSNDSSAPDHHTRFLFNDLLDPLDDAYWEGKSLYRFETQVSQSALDEGGNDLKFVALNDTVIYPDYYFNWFEIEYRRLFRAAGGQLSFAGENPGEWKYQVSGFASAQVQVFDITQPLTPTAILSPTVTASSGGYTATFAVDHPAGARFLAVEASAIRGPKSLSFYDPPDLRAPTVGADYLLIAPAELLTATQPLADYRASQGLRTRVVDMADVIDEFNEGIYHPLAIKNFIAYTFAHWPAPAPGYVVLVGDGHFNPQRFNLARYGDVPFLMPPNLSWVDPWQGEVDATNLLATVVGDDPLPDVYIGRLLVNNVSELESVIEKTMAYEQAGRQDWQQHLLFVADNIPDPAGDFEASSEVVIGAYVQPGYQAERVYLTTYCGAPTTPATPCPAATDAFVDTLNITGTLLIDFNGHGHLQRWTHEQFFINDTIASLSNADRLPVVLSMTCMDGFWIYPNRTSIIEEMVRADGKGAVAAFSPGGLGIATGHDYLQQGFYAALFRDGVRRLGPAALAAKLNLYAGGSYEDLLHTFTVLGDPALRLAIQDRVYIPIIQR